MNCKNCCELDEDKFEKITCELKNRYNLVFFLLNLLLNMKFFWWLDLFLYNWKRMFGMQNQKNLR